MFSKLQVLWSNNRTRSFLKWGTLASVLLIVALLASQVSIVDQDDLPLGATGVAVGEKVITLGSTALAAGSVDYTFDGTDDDVQFQAALNALPATGGRLVVVSSTTINFGATVSRAIDDVVIQGSGAGTYFANDGGTALFDAGTQDGWIFRDFSTDAGGLDVATATHYRLENLTLGTTYYPGSVRTATYVVAASDAPAHVKAQADYQCDGTSDESEIQSAIVAACATKGTVYLAEGNYSISAVTSLHLLGSTPHDVTIEGSGRGTILTSTSTHSIFQANGPDRMIFRNMSFIGTDQTSNHSAIQILSGSTDCVIENCYGEDWDVAFYLQTTNSIIRHCYTKSCVSVAYQMYDCSDCWVHDCFSDTDATDHDSSAILSNGTGYRNRIINNTIVNAGGQFIISSTHGTQIIGNSCYYNNDTYPGISIEDGGAYAVIADNYLLGNVVGGAGYGISLSGASAGHNTVTGNVIIDYAFPIRLTSSEHNTIQGNICEGIGASGGSYDGCIYLGASCQYNTITGNICKNSSKGGILLSGSSGNLASYNIIIGNQCFDDQGVPTQDFGIVMYNYAEYNIITGNDVSLGNTSAGYFANATCPNNKVYNNNGYDAPGETKTLAFFIDHADITDNGDATGYIDCGESIPDKARVLSVSRDIQTAFKDTVGNNTAVNVMLGDGTDDDRFDQTVANGDDIWNSGTDAEWDNSSFQGTVNTTASKTPRMTFTTDSDMTDLISGAGAQGTMFVYITYRML